MSERRPSFRQRTERTMTVGARDLESAIRKCKGRFTIIEIENDRDDFKVTGCDVLPPRPKPLWEITEKPSVYILEAPPLTAVKIGFVQEGTNVFERITTLQTGCPYPLSLVITAEGSRYLEWLAHSRFSRERLQGEWFERSQRIELFIAMLRGGKRLGAAVRDKLFD